jgi:hypothetical protein
MNDFRKSPRIYVEVPAQLSAPAEGGVYARLSTHQLSEGGCMLKGMEPTHPGRILVVLLDLDGFRVSAISKVLYQTRENGMLLTGVRFLHISPQDEAVLAEFIVCRGMGDGPEETEGPRPSLPPFRPPTH